MNWQTTTATAPAFTTTTGQNSALKSALSSVVVPATAAESGSLQSGAETDTTRTDLNQYAALQQITVTPYTHGAHNGSKQSMAFYLSTEDAQAAVASAAKRAGWPAVVLVLINADQISNFTNSLQQLADVLPLPAIRATLRRAQALATHENEKRFIKAPADLPAVRAHWRTYQHAENCAAIAEAIASDTSPADILNEYKNRRAAEINESDTLPGGNVGQAIYLTGDIAAQLQAITPPYPAAPLTAIFGWAGTVEELAQIKQELNL